MNDQPHKILWWIEELRDMVPAIFDVHTISINDAVEFLKTALESAIDMKCKSAAKLLKNLLKKRDRLFQYWKILILRKNMRFKKEIIFINQHES